MRSRVFHTPKLIATFPLKGEALAISKGIDRDRAVDESGNQIAVFNRRGSRPFNLEEMQRMYLQGGKLYTVSNDPPPRQRRSGRDCRKCLLHCGDR